MITVLKRNHLKRMVTGEDNIYADATFSNLLTDLQQIAEVCSNIGIATLVRVYPELADHEHLYFERLHAGGDEEYDALYSRVRQRYFTLLTGITDMQVKDESASEKAPSEV